MINAHTQQSERGGVGAFTLVEMLAVLAILALVAAAALPAFSSLSKASSRRTAVSVVLSTLDQARGLALAKNSAHYFLVADFDSVWPEAYRCRAYAIYEEVFNSKSNQWDCLPVTSWMLLPEGVAFDPAIVSGEPSVFKAKKVKVYCRALDREVEAPGFKFNALGGLDEPSDPETARLRLFEGSLSREGRPIPTNRAGAAREELLRVNIATGRTRRDDSTPTPAPTTS